MAAVSVERSTGDTIFTPPTGEGTAIFPWSSEPLDQGLAACSAKRVPTFLSYFKTLSIRLAPGIEPATFRSAVNRFTDWANHAAIIVYGFLHIWKVC